MKKLYKKVVSIAALAAVLALVVPLSVSAQTTGLRISPSSTDALLGGSALEFAVTVVGGTATINDADIVLDPDEGTKSVSGSGAAFTVTYTPPGVGVAAVGTVVDLIVNDTGNNTSVTARIVLTQNLAGDDCVIDAINPAPRGSCYEDTLRCSTSGSVRKCVPSRDRIGIGTWCSEFEHCDVKKVEFQFTCNKDLGFCTAAGNGVNCSDSAVNKDPDLGLLLEDVPRGDRCDRGLVCDLDDSQNGECIRDIGVEVAEELGVGSTTEDIRDQIRRLINIALGFLGVAGVVIVIYGGALWMSAAGDDEKVEKAKKTIVSGLIGLVIIGIAWTLVSYVLSVTSGLS